MRRRAVALLALSACALAALAAAAVIILPRVLFPPAIDVPALLERLDGDLAQGSLSTARDEMLALKTFPRGEADILRILKRALAVSRAGGDWTVLQAVSAPALASRPSSRDIRAVAAYSQLRTGRLAEAEKTLSTGSLPPSAGEFLRGEAALRRGSPWTGSDALTRDLLALRRSTDAAAYASAALRTGDQRLFLDAALLSMGAGRVDQALTLVKERLDDTQFAEPSAAILYDAGDDNGALGRLSALEAVRGKTARTSFLAADALQAIGHFPESAARLAEGVDLDPGLSWIPYADLAYDAAVEGRYAEADEHISDGLRRFPGSRELVMARARLAVKRGDPGQALSILQPVLKADPGNVDAALLALDLQSPSLSPEARRARLWKLFNVNPVDSRALSSLLDALFAVQDWEGAAIALRQREAAGGATDAGLLLLQGTVAAMQGDAARAVALFQKASAVRPDGKARFDMALVLLSTGNTRGAVSSVDMAALEFDRAGDAAIRDAFQSRVMEVRGEALLLGGNARGAQTALAQSLRLDPTNLRASLVLRKLAGTVP